MSGLEEDCLILKPAFECTLLWYPVSESLWKTLLYTCDRIRVEKANDVFSIMLQYYENSLYDVSSQIMSTVWEK